MKWLHISDIHFNFKNYDTNMLREKLLLFLEKQDDIDFILLTGDIVFKYGQDVEDEDVINFISQIREACRCEKEKVYICPGNHDVNRNDNARNEYIEEIRKKKKLCLENTDVNKLARYGHEKFKNIYREITGKQYSSIEVFDECQDDKNYRIISLDTSLLSKDKRDDGRISLQTDKLISLKSKIIADNKLNIVIMHHGIDFFDSKAAKAFQHWTEDYGIDVVFCGHSHQAGVKTYDETKSEIRQYTSGAALIDGYAIPSFYICNFNEALWQIEICMYTYFNDSSDWEVDNHHLRAFENGVNTYYIPRKYKKEFIEKDFEKNYTVDQIMQLQHAHMESLNERVYAIYGKKIKSSKTEDDEECEDFSVQKILISLTKIGIPLNKVFYILEKVVTQITLKSFFEKNEKIISTNDIRRCVYQQICNMPIDGEATGYEINEWSSKYARRYGHSNRRLKIHMPDGNEKFLSYKFVISDLLKDLVVKITENEEYYKNTYRNELNYIAEEIIYFLKNCDLYEVRYDILLEFIGEIATQPPHPWLICNQTKEGIIDYNQETLEKHLKNIEDGKQEEITILETVYHATAIILGYYSMVIGIHESSPISLLAQAINKMNTGEKIPIQRSNLLQLENDLNKCEIDWGNFSIIINEIYIDMVSNNNFSGERLKRNAIEIGKIAYKLIALHRSGGDKGTFSAIEEIASIFEVKEGFAVKRPLQDLNFCFWITPNWSNEQIKEFELKKQILVVIIGKNIEYRQKELFQYLCSKKDNCSDIIFIKDDKTHFVKDEKEYIKKIFNVEFRCIFLDEKKLKNVGERNGIKELILDIISSI